MQSPIQRTASGGTLPIQRTSSGDRALQRTTSGRSLGDAHHVVELQPLRESGAESSDAAGAPGFAGASPPGGARMPYGSADKPEQANGLLLLHQDNMLPSAVRVRTMLVLNLAFIMERADEAVLPAGAARSSLLHSLCCQLPLLCAQPQSCWRRWHDGADQESM